MGPFTMSRSPDCCASNAPSKAETSGLGIYALCGSFTASREIVNIAGPKKLHFQDIPQGIEIDVVGLIPIGSDDGTVALERDRGFPDRLTAATEYTSRHAARTSRQAYFRAGV